MVAFLNQFRVDANGAVCMLVAALNVMVDRGVLTMDDIAAMKAEAAEIAARVMERTSTDHQVLGDRLAVRTAELFDLVHPPE